MFRPRAMDMVLTVNLYVRTMLTDYLFILKVVWFHKFL